MHDYGRVGLTLITVAVGVALSQAQAADLPSFDDIARAIVEHRQKISDGVFVIKNDVSFGSGDLAGKTRAEIITVYLDAPDRLRGTSTRNFGEVGPRGEMPSKSFEYSVARVGSSVFEYSTVDFGGGLGGAPEVFNLSGVVNGLLTDPRLVGLAPRSYESLYRLTLKDVVYQGKYDERFVGGKRNVRGHECFELVSVRGGRTNPKMRKVVLVDPNRDHNVLRIELAGQSLNKSVNHTLDVDLQEVAGYGWFPSKLSLAEMRDGKLEKSSDVTITVKSINEGVDDQVFTLLGMGVPLGARVYDHRGDEVTEMRLTEDGLEPWSPPREKIDLTQLEQNGWSMRRALILVNALVVAAIGVMLMIRARRRSSP